MLRGQRDDDVLIIGRRFLGRQRGHRRRRLDDPGRHVELHALDLQEAPRDLVAGDAHVLGILVCLPDVIGQLAHALVEASKLLAELGQLVLDDMHLAPRLDVLDDRACRIEHRHHGRGRDDPHVTLHGVVDDLPMVRMDLREHRFGGNEHHCPIGGLPRENVALGNVAHVLAQIGAELPHGTGAIRFGQRIVEHAVVVLQGKLGIHRHQPGGIGQQQHAVDAVAIGQRVLELVCRRGQKVAHQAFQLHLAEGAACALVAEQLLQGDHVRGESVDLALCFVDGREPRHHAGEGLVGLAESFLQALVDLAADLLEARVGAARQSLDGAGELLRDGMQRVLDQLLVRPPLLAEPLQHAREQLCTQFVLLALQLGGQRRQALRGGLAVGRQLLGLRQLQHQQRVARLLQILRYRVTQAFGVVAKACADPVGQRIEAVVQILQHLQMLALEYLRDGLRQVLLPLQQTAHAQADPDHRDEGDGDQRSQREGNGDGFHARSIAPGSEGVTRHVARTPQAEKYRLASRFALPLGRTQ